MAANGEIIKSFLVGLGFDVDESSLAAFNKSIATAALRVTALYGSINAFVGSMVYAFSKISEGFEEMGYQYHIIAPAINKAIVLRNELLKAYSAAGINIRKVIVDSIRLNMSLAKTQFAMEAIYKSVGSKFFSLLTKQSDTFRKKLYENMPYIQNALEHLVKGVFKAFDVVTQLGMRLWQVLTRIYDFFVELDKATNGWSTIILGVIAAWKLLNLEFLATPLGAIIAGLVAILALFDDFKVWQEGGKSLFDWTKFLPVIEATKAVLSGLVSLFRGLVDIILDATLAFIRLFHLDFHGFFDGLKDVVRDLVPYFQNLWDSMKSIVGLGSALATFIGQGASSLADKFTGNGAANTALATNPAGKPLGNPLGSQVSNSQSHTNANMQTQINITGSPNADATAKATAAEQQNVNRDFVRNLKGATR